MVYLSLLPLNVRSRQVQAELRNPYEMHRTLSKAFGDDPAVWQEARCLFRIEEGARANDLRVLVQSKALPEWSRLTVGGGYFDGEPQTKEVTFHLGEGQSLAFRLCANPTVCRAGKRLGLETEPEQMHWLKRKGEENGFCVLMARAHGDEVVQFDTTNRFKATFRAVTFNGTLCVTNPERMMTALESGIGSGKAFGFGLLSVARA